MRSLFLKNYFVYFIKNPCSIFSRYLIPSGFPTTSIKSTQELKYYKFRKFSLLFHSLVIFWRFFHFFFYSIYYESEEKSHFFEHNFVEPRPYSLVILCKCIHTYYHITYNTENVYLVKESYLSKRMKIRAITRQLPDLTFYNGAKTWREDHSVACLWGQRYTNVLRVSFPKISRWSRCNYAKRFSEKRLEEHYFLRHRFWHRNNCLTRRTNMFQWFLDGRIKFWNEL